MPRLSERRRCMGQESLELAAPLEKFLCCLGYCLNFLAQLLRNHRASEKLRTNTLSQIRTAAQTEIRARA